MIGGELRMSVSNDIFFPEQSNYGDIEDYIREQNYEPKTDIENLVMVVCAHFEGYCEEENVDFYNNSDFSVDIKALNEFVKASGGLRERDYNI